MKRIIVVSTLLIVFIGCVAIKPNTMKDEELNQAANADCQRGAVSAAIVGAFFVGVGAIPFYLAVSHQCPINKELALKELEARKLDSITKVNSETTKSSNLVNKPADDVYHISKPQPPPISQPKQSEPKQSEPKQSTKQPMLLKECGLPIWNIGDSWKFGSGEIKIIRVEGDLYIAEDSSSSDLIAYDKNTLEKKFSIDKNGRRVKIKR
jgi:hypothetical protein